MLSPVLSSVNELQSSGPPYLSLKCLPMSRASSHMDVPTPTNERWLYKVVVDLKIPYCANRQKSRNRSLMQARLSDTSASHRHV